MAEAGGSSANGTALPPPWCPLALLEQLDLCAPLVEGSEVVGLARWVPIAAALAAVLLLALCCLARGSRGRTHAAYTRVGAEGEAEGPPVVAELRRMWGLAWPTAIATLLRGGTQQVTMIFIGHLGARELGAVAMGNLWISMSGMSIVFGAPLPRRRGRVPTHGH